MGWKVWVAIIGSIFIMSSWGIIIPEATTNLCTNPSFETGTTGWTATGASSIAQSSDESWRGIYSLKATFGGSGNIAQYNITLPTASTTYIAHCRVKVPSNWDGGDVFIDVINFVGSSDTINYQWTEGADNYDEWHYIETEFTVAADATGDIIVEIGGAPTPTRYIYIDGFQIEEKSTATTYCDGDQEGCSWQATAHASASDRSALSFAGGQVQDLTTDLSLIVQSAPGMGTTRGKNNITDFAIVPGGDFQLRKIQTRASGPEGTIKGCSLSDLHSVRAALNNALVDDLGEPVRIRYTGAATPKILKWYYERGLDYSRHDNFKERVRLVGDSTDPFWYSENETSTLLDSQDSTAFRYMAHRVKNTGVWDNMAMVSNGGAVYAFARAPDGTIYAGGNFSQINAVANTAGIAQYDPIADSWNAVGTGVTAGTNIVRDLAFDAAGNLYAVGDFTTMGGVANTSGIALWNGSAWSALGTGVTMPSSVHAVISDLSGNIYIGGTFSAVGGVANTPGIAMWDGSAWNSVAGGTPGVTEHVYALDVAQSGYVYAGGSFTTIGAVSANYVAYWDGTTWTAMGTGANGNVTELAIDSSGIIYAGGAFTTMGGATVNYIAQWNGTAWSAMGSGSDAVTVTALEVAPDGKVFASGKFTNSLHRLAIWNGSIWADADIFMYTPVDTILADNQDAVVASNYDIHIGFALAASYNHSGTVTVTNPGTTLFLPLIQVNRSGGTTATLISVRNEITGRELFLNYGLLDGETLYIDIKNQTVVSSFWGKRLDAVLPNSDFATFTLRRGANTVSCFVDTSGGPTVTAAIRGFAPFVGFDG